MTLSEKFKSSGFKKHAISKVFRVWESFPEVRIRKETEIGQSSGFTNGRLGVRAAHVMELDSVLKKSKRFRVKIVNS